MPNKEYAPIVFGPEKRSALWRPPRMRLTKVLCDEVVVVDVEALLALRDGDL